MPPDNVFFNHVPKPSEIDAICGNRTPIAFLPQNVIHNGRQYSLMEVRLSPTSGLTTSIYAKVHAQ